MHHAKYSKYGVFMNIYFIFRHVLQYVAVSIARVLAKAGKQGGVTLLFSLPPPFCMLRK